MSASARQSRFLPFVLVALASPPFAGCRAARPSPPASPRPASDPAEIAPVAAQEESDDPALDRDDEGTPASVAADDSALAEDVASHFSTRDPIYFVYGDRGRANAKFQVSFKYRILEPERPLAPELPVWKELYFGFGTTTIWNLEAESTPFFDTVYKPSLFWLRERIESWSSESLDIGTEVGLEHESNGQGGDASRSLNIVYVKPMWTWAVDEERRFSVQPKVWAYVGDLSDNPDIAEYRGNLNLRVLGYDTDGLGISTDFRVGEDFDRAYLELDLSYPMSKFIDNLDAFLHVQYFTGWGETLASYDEKAPSQVRFGIMLVR